MWKVRAASSKSKHSIPKVEISSSNEFQVMEPETLYNDSSPQEADLVFDDHRLSSKERGASEIEQLTSRIEERSANRISTTAKVGKRFTKSCRKIAKAKAYCSNFSKIRLRDLKELRNVVEEEGHRAPKFWVDCCKMLGFPSELEQLLLCLDRAIEVVQEQDGFDGNGWFYYQDFTVYYTRIESRWPWLRNSTVFSALSMLCFYLFTPIFFCFIVRDRNVCPISGSNYYEWETSLYFASVTLSTVGYGDVTVELNNSWHILSGIIYMIICNVTLIVAFSSAAESSTTIFKDFDKWILSWVWGNNKSELVHNKIRRLTFLRLSQILFTFIILNFIGVFASQIIVAYQEENNTSWGWMKSLYWAVQTTTTIGYGDLEMDFGGGMRIFQIFYLILATYFVGNTLGGLASLKDEINDMKAFETWNRRELSRGLIDELQPYHHDDKIDQYEFLVASLVILGKMSYSDVVPIMDKYRSLACEEGFIKAEEVEESDQELGNCEQRDMGFEQQIEESISRTKSGLMSNVTFVQGSSAEQEMTGSRADGLPPPPDAQTHGSVFSVTSIYASSF